jgi:hypothetical protein
MEASFHKNVRQKPKRRKPVSLTVRAKNAPAERKETVHLDYSFHISTKETGKQA